MPAGSYPHSKNRETASCNQVDGMGLLELWPSPLCVISVITVSCILLVIYHQPQLPEYRSWAAPARSSGTKAVRSVREACFGPPSMITVQITPAGPVSSGQAGQDAVLGRPPVSRKTGTALSFRLNRGFNPLPAWLNEIGQGRYSSLSSLGSL